MATSVAMMEGPVMLPPGLAKLATSPNATGSATPAMTIGIVLVAAAAEMPRHCEIPALDVAELAHPRQPGGEIVVLE